MENEQVINTSTQETSTNDSKVENIESPKVTTEEIKSVEPEIELPKDADSYKKALQSVSGKAKNDLLKELGISNVSEFKKSYAEFQQEKENLNKQLELANANYNNLKTEIETERKNNIMDALNISENSKKDFLSLVNSNMTEGKEFKDVAKDIAGKYFTQSIKLGTEKSNKVNKTSKDDSELRKLFGLK